MEPSGADKGFFQESPVLDNQFYTETYQRCFKRTSSARHPAVPGVTTPPLAALLSSPLTISQCSCLPT